MNRKVYSELLKWKLSSSRKPLILQGARQVGKTWIMQEFGRREYQSIIYVNCDNEPRMAGVFDNDYNIKRILLTLQAITGVKAVPGETLIILDEIQEVNRGLGALKYFCEDAPEYHVMVAGSLLGIALHQGTSFPVGKVDIITMYPMDFGEFLEALDEAAWKELSDSRDWALMATLRTKYIERLRQYYYVGGMPAIVRSFIEQQDLQEVRRLQRNILEAYRSDISKHAPVNEVARINMVMNAIPSQLAKENKKFIYGAIKKGARAAEYEVAIQWLIDCGIVYKVSKIRAPKLPLKFYEEMSAFKLFLLDCGLLACMGEVPADQMLIGNNVFSEFKGAFTEEYVMQQLVAMPDMYIYYWSSERSDSEIDFVVQHGSRIIPIEVKAEENVRSRSLRQFITDHPELQGVRLSMSDYRHQQWMENIPLYAVSALQ
jgi:predicted AAA+ superfamily ATPase